MLLLFVVWLFSIGATLQFTCTAPTTNRPEGGGCLADTLPGTPLSDLAALKVYRHYLHTNDTTLVLTVSAVGAEGLTLDFDVPVANGKMGIIFVNTVDILGNESCVGPQYLFAVPLEASPNQQGLRGDYFDDIEFGSYRYSQVDSVINYNWGSGSPSLLGSDTFSMLWRGNIEIPSDDIYSFYLATDDGARLWIDNAAIIDSWRPQWTELIGQAPLTKGLHPITLEYFEQSGGALYQLRYSSSTIPKQIIPSTLFSH